MKQKHSRALAQLLIVASIPTLGVGEENHQQTLDANGELVGEYLAKSILVTRRLDTKGKVVLCGVGNPALMDITLGCLLGEGSLEIGGMK